LALILNLQHFATEKEIRTMHKIISIIVHANGESEALIKAQKALNNLVQRKAYDYYRTLNHEAYWEKREDLREELPTAVLASDSKGVKLIEEGWGESVKEFLDAFEIVKQAVQHLTPEQFMEGTLPQNLPEALKGYTLRLIRFNFKVVGDESAGASTCYLYYEDEPLTTRRDLDEVLKSKMGMEAYVVLADVHF
jgi:hypothetical protein